MKKHVLRPLDERTEKDSACFVDSKENKLMGSQQSWSKERTVRHCQSEEASILWSHHEETRMWANAQRDGRPAEYKWRPLFNAAKFG